MQFQTIDLKLRMKCDILHNYIRLGTEAFKAMVMTIIRTPCMYTKNCSKFEMEFL